MDDHYHHPNLNLLETLLFYPAILCLSIYILPRAGIRLGNGDKFCGDSESSKLDTPESNLSIIEK